MHVSGHPDSLSFESSGAMNSVFRNLRLPATYFQIADGSPASIKLFIEEQQGPHRVISRRWRQ
jgi:hypothetical protein